MTYMEEAIIEEAAALHRLRPNLEPADWRLLGAIIASAPSGLAYVQIRAEAEFFGTSRKHLASLERLISEGLVRKVTIGAGRGQVFYVRTSAPLNAAQAAPAATTAPAPAPTAPAPTAPLFQPAFVL